MASAEDEELAEAGRRMEAARLHTPPIPERPGSVDQPVDGVQRNEDEPREPSSGRRVLGRRYAQL
jgi:hypothetical protein